MKIDHRNVTLILSMLVEGKKTIVQEKVKEKQRNIKDLDSTPPTGQAGSRPPLPEKSDLAGMTDTPK